MTGSERPQSAEDRLADRLDSLVEVITSMASLDFSTRAPVGSSGDGIDALSTGLNMLAEELEVSIVSRTELTAANEELGRTKERLDFLVSNSPAVIYTCAPEPPYPATYVSPNVVAPLGYQPQDFVGDPGFWASHIHPDDAPRVFAGLSRLFETGAHSHEYRFRTGDGSYRWMRDELHVVRNEAGEATELIGAWRDIADQKRAELALRESEERHRLMIQSSRDAMMTLNPPTWKFTSCNPAALTLFGVKNEAEFVTLGPWDVSPERQPGGRPSADQAAEMIQKAMREGSHFFDWTHQRLDGRPFFATVLLSRLELAGQTFLQATVRDVTKEKAADREVRRLNDDLERRVAERTAEVQASERRFHDLFESGPDATVMVDAEGLIMLINQRGEALFGYGRDELIGQPVEKLVPASRRTEHVNSRRRYHQSGGPRDGVARTLGDEQTNIRGLKKDGVEFPAEISLSPLQVGDGLYVAAAVRDITERVRASEALAESLREKEVLLKEIHHRVKNNLQIVSSLLAMQADASGDDTALAVLRECIHRVRSMALIHERLYQSESLARIDFGEYATSLANFLFRSYAVSGTVQLLVETEPTELNIGTAVPLGLILNELVSNALKHAFKDGRPGTLRVTLRPAGDGFALVVADTGPGLPSGFDVEKANSLGLNLVSSLVQQLKATMTIERDGGASFRIECKELQHAS